MKFNPEITTGTILTIVSMVATVFIAYSAIDKQVSNQQIQIRALEVKDGEMTARGNERYGDLKLEIKELKSSVGDIKESLAIIRGRMAEPTPRGSK